jgi:hypothetical protein
MRGLPMHFRPLSQRGLFDDPNAVVQPSWDRASYRVGIARAYGHRVSSVPRDRKPQRSTMLSLWRAYRWEGYVRSVLGDWLSLDALPDM